MSGKSLTLAHLSDLHLTTLQGVRFRQLLGKRLLGYLSWHRRRRHQHLPTVLDRVVAEARKVSPDLFLLSGDLTHLGLDSEIAQAARWLETLDAPENVMLVPGNHDHYRHDTHWLASGAWAPYLAGDEPGNESAPSLRVRGNVALIGVDCAEPAPVFLATGHVGERQRQALADLLQAQHQRFRVVMLHHSPLPDGHAWRKRLTDAREMMEVLRQCGAELVVYGHGHRARLEPPDLQTRTPCIAAAPSASLNVARRGGWNLYRINETDSGWSLEVELHGYDPATGNTSVIEADTFSWPKR